MCPSLNSTEIRQVLEQGGFFIFSKIYLGVPPVGKEPNIQNAYSAPSLLLSGYPRYFGSLLLSFTRHAKREMLFFI
jgi:hypothetical protein